MSTNGWDEYWDMIRHDINDSASRDEQEQRDREQQYYPDALAELRSRISHLAGPKAVREGEW